MTNKQAKTYQIGWKTLGSRILGVVLSIAGMMTYLQIIPFVFVYIGAYMGLSGTATFGHIDTLIWVFTCLVFVAILSFVGITGMKALWRKFFTKGRIFVVGQKSGQKLGQKHAK